ncbi:bacteriocin [Leptolyngbya sp. GGD]|uniref:bacteriocin n=1 Tax=Leptolyngbya sp. GGD TaxID=2997907 RepID=UPI00227D4618|nr:bacteriocin [Leptolyngbya sp. GGD]MCY6493882.1 bacteriocin [Leptolyngbya sp. GGD]
MSNCQKSSQDDRTEFSTILELSEQELDQISGGISFFLSGSIFDQQISFTRRGRRKRGNSQGNSNTFSSAFQFGGSGFSSIEDVLNILKNLSSFFGRRN